MWPVLALALTTGAAPVFVNQTPTNPPAPRRSCDAALKPGAVGDSLSIFGGFSGSTLSDFATYSSSTNAWSGSASVTLPPRERHSMGYDPVHDLIVIVGGVNGLTVSDSVFLIGPSFSVSTPPLPGSRPSARMDAALHWVPSLQKFVYFGGSGSVFANSHFNDLWTLDVGDGGVTWQPIIPDGGRPSVRGAVCSGVDPDGNRLVMFGGETNGASSAELWTFSFAGNAWSLPVTNGTGPSARSFCAGDWEPNLKQLVVYGGQTTAPTGGLFSFNPATNVWTPYTPAINPGTLSDSAGVYSPQLKGILFFGGRSASTTYTNATWLLRFNRPPVADAGADFSIAEGASGALSGSHSDPEGDPLTSSWLQLQGPVVTLSSTTQLSPAFTAPRVVANTVLRFLLTSNDGTSTGTDEVAVTVLEAINEPPVANAGPDLTADGGALVVLAGAGTDPNGQPLTFGWSQLVGPPVTLSSPGQASTSFVAPSIAVPTALGFRLVVNDGTDVSAPDDVFVTVNATPPVDAGSDSGVPDSGVPDSGVIDSGVPDSGVPDSGVPDAGVPDAGVPDSGVPDSGVPDSGVPDSGVPDSGVPDSGVPDAGVPDAGVADAGGGEPGTDGGSPDAGAVDGGSGGEDGGTGERELTVSCGCTQAPAALGWFAGLVLLGIRRRPIR